MSAESLWIIILVLCLLGGILSGLPVMLAIAGVPTLIAIGASLTGSFDLVFFQAVPQRVFGIMENTLLLAVPLFVLMGVLLDKSKQAERMLSSISTLFGSSQSALALSVIVVSTMIAASTGIIGATIVMLGTISLPTLLKAGIDRNTSCGLICASGTLGQIIPPSIILILLGDQVSNAYIEAQQSVGNFAPDPVTVGDLFAGAIVPGLLLVCLYGLYVLFRLRRADGATVGQAEPATIERRTSLFETAVSILPTFGLICAVLGSILVGVATPTEAASIGVAGTLLVAIGLQSRKQAFVALAILALAIGLLLLRINGLVGVDFTDGKIVHSAQTWTVTGLVICLIAGLMYAAASLFRSGILYPALLETLLISGMIFGIIIAASILSLVFRGFEGDDLVADILEGLPGSAYGMLLLTMVIIFFLGFILEFVEIIFIVIPIVGPIILQADISPVWFAILIAMNLQTSFLTPPFGFALFYFRSVAPKGITTTMIYRSVIPFVIIQIIAIGLLAVFPILATWLPDQLF